MPDLSYYHSIFSTAYASGNANFPAAKEWGQYGICVNVVLPGAESPAAKAWAQKFPEEYAKQVNLNPMKRFGDPENDIAPVVAFLAGPDSCYYSGQSVIVDGANSIMP